MFVSIELVRIINNFTNKETKHISIGIVLIVLMLFPLSQSIRDLPIRRKWVDSDMYQYIKISKEINSLTKIDDEIFSFSPALITLAERNVAFNNYEEVFELEAYIYMDRHLTENYDLINIKNVIDGLNNQNFEAILLREPGRLDDNTGGGRILIPFRYSIKSAIKENYYLVKSWEYGRNKQKKLSMYFPK